MSVAVSILLRTLKWLLIVIVVLWLLLVLAISFLSFNFMRGPIERMTKEKTGRELSIGGDLKLKWAWPIPHVVFNKVTFANPPWAKQPQMLSLESAEATFDLSEMLKRVLVIIEVRVVRPEVYLEQSADGRKNWLLDTEQKDEKARVSIGRLLLDSGHITYVDEGQKTRIEADVSTRNNADVTFDVKGVYKDLPLAAQGSGGPVLALREETHPYPLKIQATIGQTSVGAEGSITSLTTLAAVDLNISLRGRSLAQLYPLIGIALPETPRYDTTGHVVHKGDTWRYEDFAGKIGTSDVAGTLQVDLRQPRPFLHGEVKSKLLDIADLGPTIGTSSSSAGSPVRRVAREATGRVLPDEPFHTERWDSVDADVILRAGTLKASKELPLQNVETHIKMKDAVLSLDPLNFDAASGRVESVITLDGRRDPIRAKATVRAQGIQIGEILQSAELEKAGIGQIDADFELAGTGNSVARMLGNSNGKVGIIVPGGEVSAELMSMVAIDLWHIAKYKMAGDEPVKIRCGVVDFGVENGVMRSNALDFDTQLVNVLGGGTIDLNRERLDITLNPKPKQKSIASLRTPLYITGPLGSPSAGPDKTRLAARGLGAIALGIVAPLLAVAPLIETGPGEDSDCGKLVAQAKTLPKQVAQPAPKERQASQPREEAGRG
jgi:AsmA protein